MSRHISHLTLTHPTRPEAADIENISGHFRQLDVGDALVLPSTELRAERTYRVASVRRERVLPSTRAGRRGYDRGAHVEFVLAVEVQAP